MNKTKQQQRLATLSDGMRAILEKAEAEGRELTAEEIAEYDAKKAEADRVRQTIARIDEQEKLDAELNKVTPAAATLQAVNNQFAGGVPDQKKQFENFGEFLCTVAFRPNDQRLEFHEGIKGEGRTDTGSAGGYAIPKQYIKTLKEFPSQESIIRPRSTVIGSTENPDAEISFPALDQGEGSNMFGGISVQWAGEGAESDDSGMKLKEVTYKPNEVIGSTVVTNKLLRNWSAAGSILQKKFNDALAAAEDIAFLKGDGVAKPLGILQSGALMKVNRLSANTVTYDDVLLMFEKLNDTGNAGWIASRTLVSQLMKLKDDAGNLIWAESAREGIAGTLLGIPVTFSKRNPNKGSLGDLFLSSFSEYIIQDGLPPLVSASEHVHFKSNKTVIKIVSSVDGGPSLSAPIKNEDGNLYSPFVALDIPSVG